MANDTPKIKWIILICILLGFPLIEMIIYYKLDDDGKFLTFAISSICISIHTMLCFMFVGIHYDKWEFLPIKEGDPNSLFMQKNLLFTLPPWLITNITFGINQFNIDVYTRSILIFMPVATMVIGYLFGRFIAYYNKQTVIDISMVIV